MEFSQAAWNRQRQQGEIKSDFESSAVGDGVYI